MADDSKTPIEQALELLVYAPLGLALTARDNLPALVEKGRQQVSSQVMMAKMVGQFAVGEAERQARKRVDAVAENLAARYSAPPAPAPAEPTAPPAAASEPAPTPAAPVENAPAPNAASGNGKVSRDEPRAAVPSSDHLAIPGYDTLSASQVVQRLAGLSSTELEAVREYEAATRGRRTILTKVAQLQSAS
ncbi:MAG TPA: hypothetical protein VHN98_11945 [Acidimicrobiales bacterium]|nr:hypothetical protein [Acidimicrobiales bacterium]